MRKSKTQSFHFNGELKLRKENIGYTACFHTNYVVNVAEIKDCFFKKKKKN